MHEDEKAKPHNGLRHDQRCFFKLSRCCPHVTSSFSEMSSEGWGRGGWEILINMAFVGEVCAAPKEMVYVVLAQSRALSILGYQ